MKTTSSLKTIFAFEQITMKILNIYFPYTLYENWALLKILYFIVRNLPLGRLDRFILPSFEPRGQNIDDLFIVFTSFCGENRRLYWFYISNLNWEEIVFIKIINLETIHKGFWVLVLIEIIYSHDWDLISMKYTPCYQQYRN